MKRKSIRIIEIVVAITVLVLLLIVVFPRFQNAQVLTKVAAAKKDLNAIIQAMEAYRLDQGGDAIQRVLLSGDLQNKAALKTYVYTLALPEVSPHPIKMDRILPGECLLPYIKQYPIPQLPLQIEGNSTSTRTLYLADRHAYRQISRPYTGINDDEASFWFSLREDFNQCDYFGASHGPLYIYPNRYNAAFKGRNQFVVYETTNGIISHGYVVMQQGTVSPGKGNPVPTPAFGSEAESARNDHKRTEPSTSLPPFPITNADSLVRYQKNLFSTLMVDCRGVNLEKFPEADISFVLSYGFAGENRQLKSIESPQGNKTAISKYIFNHSDFYYILNSGNMVQRIGQTDSSEFARQHGYFLPLWFLVPFRQFTDSKDIAFAPFGETGLIRVQWAPYSLTHHPDIFHFIDILIDPSIDYLPRKCLLANPSLSLQMVKDAEEKIWLLDVWYAELDDYQKIEGVYFPKRMKIIKWEQAREDRYPETNSRFPFRNKGFKIPDIIGGESLPVFETQYDVTLTSVRINQSIDEKVFLPD